MVQASNPTPVFRDTCGFGEMPEITEKLNAERNGNYLNSNAFVEKILFSCRVNKFNRFNMKQERDFLCTNLYLYNIKSKSKSISNLNLLEIKRPIGIAKLMAFTCSSQAGVSEFIIHVKNDYDYRFSSDE